MTDQSKSRFWDNYIVKTKSYGVKNHLVRWYVKHAEDYIKAHSGTKLADHTAVFVEQYLAEKGRKNRLDGWQFRQMIIAIKLLFTEMVQLSWASSIAWDDWLLQADALGDDHATLARDFVQIDVASIEQGFLAKNNKASSLFKQVFSFHANYIKRLIIEIRLKQYSIRTEHAYLAWFLRFEKFHDMKGLKGTEALNSLVS